MGDVLCPRCSQPTVAGDIQPPQFVANADPERPVPGRICNSCGYEWPDRLDAAVELPQAEADRGQAGVYAVGPAISSLAGAEAVGLARPSVEPVTETRPESAPELVPTEEVQP